MGTCPNCGNDSLLLKQHKCLYDGKKCCEKCATYVLTVNAEDKWACSPECKAKYEQKVLEYPLEEVGINFDKQFYSLVNELWYKACMAALDTNDSSSKAWVNLQKISTRYAMRVTNIQTQSSKHKYENDLHDRFLASALLVLADNMEKAGRPLDAARIYQEKELRMFDKARALREKTQRLTAKRTNVALDLDQLLQQVQNGGVATLYRCSHCGGELNINKNVDISELETCKHCGSEVDSTDLADFLKTTLLHARNNGSLTAKSSGPWPRRPIKAALYAAGLFCSLFAIYSSMRAATLLTLSSISLEAQEMYDSNVTSFFISAFAAAVFVAIAYSLSENRA